MLHDYQNRGVAEGAVRKSMKTKGRLRGEARVAVRNALKIKEGELREYTLFCGGKALSRGVAIGREDRKDRAWPRRRDE